MHLRPILSSLRRHRTAATLVVLEIALSCAIVCNAVFLVRERLSAMTQPSGVVEDELLFLNLSGIGTADDATATTAQDLRALRALPGVRFAASVAMIPFGGNSWNSEASAASGGPRAPRFNTAMYMGSEDMLETMGLQPIAGRDFTPDEYADLEDVQEGKRQVASIILTRTLAERLFPGKNPLGQAVNLIGDAPQTVVGIIEHLARPNESDGSAAREYAAMLPVRVPYASGAYLLRADPRRHAEILAATDPTLRSINPNRVLLQRLRFSEVRADHFKNDRSMAYLLTSLSLALLIVTAFGVVGLASFWVQQRTRQIGVRRALGATRGDILRYFQLENLLLTSCGIALGMGAAYGINLWLMSTYQVSRLPASYLPLGALTLWVLGQLAVLAPALRASKISPALATRSV